MTRGGITGDDEAELIVVGGGLVGLTLAIACAEGGIRTIVVEAEPAEALTGRGYDGRSAAVAYGSQQVLTAIGAWERLAPDAQPILDIRVTDGGWHMKGEGHGHVHYSHLDLLDRKPTPLPPDTEPTTIIACEPDQPPAPFGYIIENRLTRVALLERAKTCASLTHLAPHVVTALDLASDAARVTLEDGSVLTAQLVVAADGKQSALRRMAGIAAREFGYSQAAIVCTVTHQKPHNGVAHEHFLPAGPFAMLPMTDETLPDGAVRHRSSIVWSEDPRLVPMLSLIHI